MARRRSILEKKLKELESELNAAFFHSPSRPTHHQYCKEIEQRLAFLKSLVSAEMASSGEMPPHHMREISSKIEEMEAAFPDWDEFKRRARDYVEAVSGCFSGSSSLYDGDDEDGSRASSLHVENENADEKVEVEQKEGGERCPRARGRRGGRVGVAMAGGLLVGMGLMGLMDCLCGRFSYLVVNYIGNSGSPPT